MLIPPNKKRKISGKIEKAEHQIVSVAKTSTFVPLQDALGVDWTVDEQKKVNKLSPWYFLARGIYYYNFLLYIY